MSNIDTNAAPLSPPVSAPSALRLDMRDDPAPQPSSGGDWFDALLQDTSQAYERTATRVAQDERASEGPIGKARDLVTSFGRGGAKALYETKDFVLGEPSPDEKSDIRRRVEFASDLDARASTANAVSAGIGQFVTGFVGAGKFVKGAQLASKGLKAITTGSKIARVATEIAKGAAVQGVAFDPHQERLSNLIQSYPSLANPVTAYLAADPSDSNAEGRFKAAAESIGLDVALSGALAASLRGYKALRGGNAAVSETAGREANKILAERAAKIAARETPTYTPAERMGRLPGFEDTPLGPQPFGKRRPAQVQQGTTASTRSEITRAADPADDATYRLALGATLRDGEVSVPAIREEAGITAATAKALISRMERDGVVSAADAKGKRIVMLSEEADTDALPSLQERPRQPAPGRPVEPPAGAREVSPGAQPQAPATPAQAAPTGTPQPKRASGLPRAFDIGRDLSPAGAKAILKQARADADAIDQFGSISEAAANGHKFAPIRIPWQRMADNQTAATINRLADELAPEWNRLKGGDVLTDARANALMMQRARLFGEDPEAMMATLQGAGGAAREMVTNLDAGWLIANGGMRDLFELGTKSELGAITGREAAEQARQRLVVIAEIAGQSNAIKSNAARALRRQRGEFKPTTEQLNALATMDDEALLKAIRAAEGDPAKLIQLANPETWGKQAARWASFLITSNPLWLFPTHVRNLLSGVTLLYQRPIEALIGGAFQRGSTGQAIRRQAIKELRITHAFLKDGWDGAVQAFKSADNPLASEATEHFAIAPTLKPLPSNMRPMTSIENVAFNAMLYARDPANLIGTPLRALGSMDALIQTMRYRAVVSARAALKAEDLGLSEREAREFIEQRMREAFDESGRATDVQALAEARITALQQPLEREGNFGAQTLGSLAQGAVAANPLWRLVLTYVRTPTNALRYGVRMTPGLQFAQREFREMFAGKRGPDAQAHAYGQMSLGLLALASGWMFAENGQITGSGPANPNALKELKKTGWRPLAFHWTGDDGTVHWAPLSSIGPAFDLLALGADLRDVLSHPDAERLGADKDAEGVVTAAVMAMASNVADKSYLYSLKAALDFMNDPDRSGAKYLGRTLGGLIPGASLWRGLRDDPYMHEARTLVDNIKANLPGFSKTLPIAYGPIGEPVSSQGGLWTSAKEDALDVELRRMAEEEGRALTPPDPVIGGADLRKVTTEKDQNAYERFNQLIAKPTGAPRSLREELKRFIETDRYRTLVDGASDVEGTRLHALQPIVRRYRQAALAQLKRESPAVATAIRERADTTKAEVLANRLSPRGAPGHQTPQATIEQAQRLMQAFGLGLPPQATQP